MKRHRDGQRVNRERSLAAGVTPRSTLPAADEAAAPAPATGDGFAELLAHWWNQGWLPGLLLILATVLAYQPAWHGGFLWDDDMHISQNRMLFEPGGLKQIWSSPESPQYYPLVFTSFRLEQALWGLNPTGYHWVNLLLHAASAVWVWRILRRLNVPGAWLAAAVFAVHPVNVESVAWISQRKNTLAMFFYLLSFFCYLRFDPAPRSSTLDPRLGNSPQPATLNPQPIYYWLSLAAFALALLSKTAVSPFPLVLLGLAWWRRGSVTGREVWRSAPFFGAALVLGLVTIWFERHQTETFAIVRDDNFWSRLAGAGWAVWFYLYKALLPLNLIPIYPHWLIDTSKMLTYVPGTLLVGAFLLLWCYRRRWGGTWLFCAGYYVVMLAPVLGFVNIGFMGYSLVADHWQYFSVIAPIAAVSAGLATWFTRAGKRAPWLGAVLGGAVVVLLGGLTWRQSALYANAETFWRGTVAANPRCWSAHYALGVVLVQKGSVDEAITQYQQVLGRLPYNALVRFNLGAALLQKGRVDEAIAQYQQALELQAGKAYARYNPKNAFLPKTGFYADARYNLGNAFLQKQRLDDAITQYQKALELQPGDADVHSNLGLALFLKRRLDESASQFQKAIRLNPAAALPCNGLGKVYALQEKLDDATAMFLKAIRLNPELEEAHYNLGNVYHRQGKLAEAIAEWKTALHLKPDDIEAQKQLADVLVKMGRVAEALPYCEAVVRTQPGDAHARFALGSACLAAKRPEQAVASFKEALRLAPDAPECMNGLAWIYATTPRAELRNGPEAVRLAEAACRITKRQKTATLDTLAAAYAEAGRFDEAVKTTEEIRALAVSAHDTNTVNAARQRLELYQAGKPYRDE